MWEKRGSEVDLGRNLRLGMLCAVGKRHRLPSQKSVASNTSEQREIGISSGYKMENSKPSPWTLSMYYLMASNKVASITGSRERMPDDDLAVEVCSSVS